MTSPSRLPTLDKLGVALPSTVDAASVAASWFQDFDTCISKLDVDGIAALFAEDALWKDLLALTWDMRCFDGVLKIKTFLNDRLALSKLTSLKLRNFAQFQRPFPDVAWVIAMFDFETDVGIGSGVVRLIPSVSGAWKAFTMFTTLDDLKQFPERIGALRDRTVRPGYQWKEERQKESNFDTPPAVLIVGGGHCGLELAARLKFLGVTTLVVEAEERIGDKWRKRYDSLCLHWPVCESGITDEYLAFFETY